MLDERTLFFFFFCDWVLKGIGWINEGFQVLLCFFLLQICLALWQAETHHSSCENRGHTKVPRGFSPETRLLDMRGNNFHYIPSNSFPGVAQVISLHLQRCKIVDVEDGAFSGMKGLIYLYLSENDLTSLKEKIYKVYSFNNYKLGYESTGLPQLTYLHLEKNRFADFPKGAFKLVPSLLALHLENNAITKLEAGILTGALGLRDYVNLKIASYAPPLPSCVCLRSLLHMRGHFQAVCNKHI
uniref:Chondroadherin-like b n=1 Tax=Poecilia reticulata TaxID=8081 RepID=A0A3P9Q9L2_POERE